MYLNVTVTLTCAAAGEGPAAVPAETWPEETRGEVWLPSALIVGVRLEARWVLVPLPPDQFQVLRHCWVPPEWSCVSPPTGDYPLDYKTPCCAKSSVVKNTFYARNGVFNVPSATDTLGWSSAVWTAEIAVCSDETKYMHYDSSEVKSWPGNLKITGSNPATEIDSPSDPELGKIWYGKWMNEWHNLVIIPPSLADCDMLLPVVCGREAKITGGT